MTHDAPGYGLWTLVVLNSAIFLMFAFSFFKPQTGRDWRMVQPEGTLNAVALYRAMPSPRMTFTKDPYHELPLQQDRPA